MILEQLVIAQSWPDWFWQNAATLLLAALAMWAGCIAFRTLNAVRAQVDIANRGLTKLERAWIMVVPHAVRVEPQAGTALTQRSITFSWTIRNVGRSPAWITGGKARDEKTAQSNLVPLPNYGEVGQYSPTPIPPDEKGRAESIRRTFTAAYNRYT